MCVVACTPPLDGLPVPQHQARCPHRSLQQARTRDRAAQRWACVQHKAPKGARQWASVGPACAYHSHQRSNCRSCALGAMAGRPRPGPVGRRLDRARGSVSRRQAQTSLSPVDCVNSRACVSTSATTAPLSGTTYCYHRIPIGGPGPTPQARPCAVAARHAHCTTATPPPRHAACCSVPLLLAPPLAPGPVAYHLLTSLMPPPLRPYAQ